MYFDGTTEVRLGDQVTTRILFRRRIGRVVYVPGISAPNPEFENKGLRSVGIRLVDDSLVATVVRPKTGALKEKIVFLRRDESPCKLITPDSREFERDGEALSP